MLDQRREQVVGESGRAGRGIGIRLDFDDQVLILALAEQAIECFDLVGISRGQFRAGRWAAVPRSVVW